MKNGKAHWGVPFTSESMDLQEKKLRNMVGIRRGVFSIEGDVAVSCGYDTWFAVRLVMDYATSHFTWSILGYLSDLTRSSQPWPDTQVSRCLWFPPSTSCLRVYMGCALALILQVRSLYVPCYMVHFQGSISGSP